MRLYIDFHSFLPKDLVWINKHFCEFLQSTFSGKIDYYFDPDPSYKCQVWAAGSSGLIQGMRGCSSTAELWLTEKTMSKECSAPDVNLSGSWVYRDKLLMGNTLSPTASALSKWAQCHSSASEIPPTQGQSLPLFSIWALGLNCFSFCIVPCCLWNQDTFSSLLVLPAPCFS